MWFYYQFSAIASDGTCWLVGLRVKLMAFKNWFKDSMQKYPDPAVYSTAIQKSLVTVKLKEEVKEGLGIPTECNSLSCSLVPLLMLFREKLIFFFQHGLVGLHQESPEEDSVTARASGEPRRGLRSR